MEPKDTTKPAYGGSNADRQGSDEQAERIKQAGKDATENVRRKARSRLEEGKDTAAAAADDTRSALEAAGSRLSEQGHETLAQAAYQASERISTLAEYIETHSLDELTQEARRLARSNPALMIAGGVALGFALSRFFKASGMHHATAQQQDYGGSFAGSQPSSRDWSGDGEWERNY